MRRIINNQNQRELRRELRKNQTKQEALLWEELRNKKIGFKFRRQTSIGVYIADFYCAEKSLVIELDGSQHIENKNYDKERETFFESIGVTTLRFWNNEVDTDIERVVEKIKNTTSPLTPLLKGEGKPPSAPRRRGLGDEVSVLKYT